MSVIIPCYNYGKFLREAVESVVKQNYMYREIIIVNDGSTDNTATVLQEIVRDFPQERIIVISQANQGQIVSRNIALRRAKGEFVLPLDADDLLAPQALEALVHSARTHAVVFGYSRAFGASESFWRTNSFDVNELLYANQLPYCALYSIDLWHETGGYNHAMRGGYEDWNFWISCAEVGAEFIHIEHEVLLYRQHDTETVSVNTSARIRHEWLIAHIVRLHEQSYSQRDREWSKQYLEAHPEPPQTIAEFNEHELYADVRAEWILRERSIFGEESYHKALQFLHTHGSSYPTRGLDNVRRTLDQNIVTVFVISVGDPALELCKKHIEYLRPTGRISYVVNRRPMNRAFQEMIDRATTDYFVQVDEDMMLNENALSVMVEAMEQAEQHIAMICFYLWDDDREQRIQGIKIYRTKHMKELRWLNKKASEMDIIEQMKSRGYDWIADERVVGRHGVVYTPRTIYHRYKTMYEKDIRVWNSYPKDIQRQVKKFVETGDILQLFALLGSAHGIINAPFAHDTEKDFLASENEYAYRVLEMLLSPLTPPNISGKSHES